MPTPLPRIALIPAYMPGQKLLDLLPEVKAAGLFALLVDDGSGPDFAPVFAEAQKNAVLLTHAVNRGKGRALKTGYTYIREHFPDGAVIVTLDADGQHRMADALKLLAEAERHPEALVLGSRTLSAMPRRSRFGNTVTRFVYRLCTGVRVRDTQTGLRAFDAALLPRMLEIEGERYEYEMNVLMDFARAKIPILEVGIETIYFDKNSGSHFSVFRDSYLVYRGIFQYSRARGKVK